MLSVARDAWERGGYQPIGAALSGIATENLESGSGIASRTLASLEHQWSQDRELLGPNNVLVNPAMRCLVPPHNSRNGRRSLLKPRPGCIGSASRPGKFSQRQAYGG
jgi:hypothetical protein